MITCNEIIKSYEEEIKTISKNFNEKKATWKKQNFYIFLVFLLITTELLIACSIYCYLVKYRAKRKHVLPFYDTNNQLRQVLY